MTFWNEKRRRVYPRLIVTLVVIWTALGFAVLWARAASHDERYGGDFVVYWSAATLAEQGHPEDVFNFSTLLAQERRTVPDTGLYPWHYPPQFLLVVRPFAAVSYPVALVAWTVGGVLLLYLAVSRIAGLSPGTIGLPLSGVVINAGFGQNGALTGAMLGLGLSLVSARPFLGGLVLGLLTYKPHLAAVALLFLLATRNWRACWGAGLSACTLAAVSLAAFGADTWIAFFDNGSRATRSLFESGGWQLMPSPLALVQLVGGSAALAVAAQAVWSLAFLAAVAWLVFSKAPERLIYAGVVTASLAVSPYVFVYDAAALAPALAWFLRESGERGLRTGERFALGALALGWPLVWAIAAAMHVQLGPALLLAFMAVVVNRAKNAPERATDTAQARPESVGIPYKQGLPVTK